MKSILRASIAVFALGAFAGMAHSNEISFSVGSTLAPTETAGAPGANASHFNALTASGTLTTLTDNTGATVSGASAIFTANGFGFTTGGGTNDAHLFTGWLDQDTANPSTLAITGVPYSQYDVYIYMHNDTDGNNRTGAFTIGSTTHYVRGPGSADTSFKDPGQGGGYVVSNDTSQTSAAATTEGDYTVFSGLSGSSLNISFAVGAAGDLARNKFSGVQIVQTPEPASLSLLALGAVGLLARRRR